MSDRRIFIGLLAALVFSWIGVVLWPASQLGALAPFLDTSEDKTFPERPSGTAAQGELVYADLGCAACHTQQVRRPGFGSDKERGWGNRQSVPRDYVYNERVQLGESRIGPDLANVGGRTTPYEAEDFYRLLYSGVGKMPAYRFLFDAVPLAGRQSSHQALRLNRNFAAVAGNEIVPTPRARSLVAYLLSLNHPYEYPEARPVLPTSAKKDVK